MKRVAVTALVGGLLLATVAMLSPRKRLREAPESKAEVPSDALPEPDSEELVKWIPILVPLSALALVVDVYLLVTIVL